MVVKAVPGVEDEAAGVVFSVFAEFTLFEHAKGLVDAAGAADVFGVENVAEFIGGESEEMCDDGIELGLKDGATIRVEDERLFTANVRHLYALFIGHFFPQFFCPSIHVVIEVYQFNHSFAISHFVLSGIWSGARIGNCLTINVLTLLPPNFCRTI